MLAAGFGAPRRHRAAAASNAGPDPSRAGDSKW
jgi:hypothetical protein